eukprot:436289_1
MASEKKYKKKMKFVYVEEIEDDSVSNQDQWTFLSARPLRGMNDYIMQYIFPIDNNKKLLIYNYELSKYEKGRWWKGQNSGKKFVTMYSGFIIYDIVNNKWTASSKWDVKNLLDNFYDGRRIFSPNTAIYNDNAKTLMMYEIHTKILNEYNIKNNTWNYEKYSDNTGFALELPWYAETTRQGAYPGYMEFGYAPTQQGVIVNDKIHVFECNDKEYKHWIYNYFNNETVGTLVDDTEHELVVRVGFDAETQIMYCKLFNCLFVLDKKGGPLYQYSIVNKQWYQVPNINFKYHKMRSVICRNGKNILFFGGYDYKERLRSKAIFIYDVKTQEIIKSKVTLPTNHYYSSAIINEYGGDQNDNKVLFVIYGFVRANYGNDACLQDIVALIDAYTPSQCLYILSSVGFVYKIAINNLFG